MVIPYVTQGMIFAGVLNIAPERWPSHAAKLAAVLAALGWKSKRQDVGGTKVTTYYPAGYDASAEPSPPPAAVTPQAKPGHCVACAKPSGRGPGKCQPCGVCEMCLDTPQGLPGACHCEPG
jgi:hypothetical protein